MSRPLQFSSRQLLGAVTLAAVAVRGWNWLTRKVLDIRAPTASDVDGQRGKYTYRTVAVASGGLLKGTSLRAVLFLVRSGVRQGVSTHSLKRPELQGGGQYRVRVRIPLKIRESDAPSGRISDVFIDYDPSVTSERFRVYSWRIEHNIEVSASEIVSGQVTAGRSWIVYAEGDRPIVLSRGMSLDEFARKNSGNYLVLTFGLD